MQEGLGVTSVPDHADPQRTEEKALPRGVGGSRPSEGGDLFVSRLHMGSHSMAMHPPILGDRVGRLTNKYMT